MQAVQKPQMNVVQEIQNEFTEQLIKRPFPVHNLSQDWREAAYKALEYASPFSLQVSAEEFKKLIYLEPTAMEGYALSLFQFAVLSNNLESRSARDLDLDIFKYSDLMIEAMKNVEWYQKHVEELRKECEKKIADEHAMRKAVEKGIDQPSFKTVKGEA